MTKVFLDTNIVLDFLLKREGFSEEAAIIFDLEERKKLNLALSSPSVNNIDYVISKVESKKKVRRIITKLLSLVDILSVGESTIEKAAMSEFKDFEDAIQNFVRKKAV
jgi:predicted nucleic acid-binding protein